MADSPKKVITAELLKRYFAENYLDRQQTEQAIADALAEAGGITEEDIVKLLEDIDPESGPDLQEYYTKQEIDALLSALSESWETPTEEEIRALFGTTEPSSGSGYSIGLPKGGTAGQFLRKQSDVDGDAAWADLPAYSGAYEASPSKQPVSLNTAASYLDRDIVVRAVPYEEEANTSGGYTVKIGADN